VLSKMKTISMFHHGYIPRSLIGNIMQSHRRTVSSADPDSICLNNKVDSGSFIDRMADFTFCNVGEGANVANVYFHKLVFFGSARTFKKLGEARVLSAFEKSGLEYCVTCKQRFEEKGKFALDEKHGTSFEICLKPF